jgi:protein CpxP
MTHKPLNSALTFVLAAALAAGPLAFAQAPQQTTPDAPAPSAQTGSNAASARTLDPHRQAMRISKELNLTPDQAAKLEPILADRDQKLAALRANTALAPKDARKQMHAIQQSTRNQLSTVLTPDQLNQLESMQHAHGRQGQAPATAPSA